MANKENQAPFTPCRGVTHADEESNLPGSASIALGLRPWQVSTLTPIPFRALSPGNKPALHRQRDHSACGQTETPLRVRKTRENLRQDVLCPDIPPPCLFTAPASPNCAIALPTSHCHSQHRPSLEAQTLTHTGASNITLPTQIADDYPTISPLVDPPSPAPRIQRHRSVSRRMLSKVKQGIASRTKATGAVRPNEPETTIFRRLSNTRKKSSEVERREDTFDTYSSGIDVSGETTPPLVVDTEQQPTQRSFTDSTVSTNEILGNETLAPYYDGCPGVFPSCLSSPPSSANRSPSTELTPRPPIKAPSRLIDQETHLTRLSIPHVLLNVTADRMAVDAGSTETIWVAVEGTVLSRALDVSTDGAINFKHFSTQSDDTSLGSVTSLRLCFKPAPGCQILDIVGQKTAKDLKINQTCSLFVSVSVPKLNLIAVNDSEPDNSSLFEELESIVGTLDTDLLHVEARYRHSLLRHDNVVNVRHTSKLRRPKSESRWSLPTALNDLSISDEVHTKIAIHLADHYSPRRAIGLINRCLGVEVTASEAVRQVRETLLRDLGGEGLVDEEPKPSVIVTDIDTLPSGLGAEPSVDDSGTTAPATFKSACVFIAGNNDGSAPTDLHLRANRRSTSASALTIHPPPSTRPHVDQSFSSTNISSLSITQQDDARKLWRHIRQSSLSTKQAAELESLPVHQIEAKDEKLRELRKQALANKRSVGAETLKDWKWTEKMEEMKKAEMPWL
ncbi:hypothetical protein KC332_g11787 [Hortaea werneckii]|uniref:Uncharacterized protein n=2 Tax=Hortaea werneckii TaxID=91943 RepID=A0A3M7IGM5_HORWE|nr:hypothetical protein KC358_g12437 [Hortaea werneckii]OTA24111.1 hypothetical protein BTJ68_13637 [Hortaea werneckii EXF-2000]KAI6829046.1 hypothetical protein KC350_g7941 [Hortaea werneckii]KAI6927747.1 hypothetical protein KC341_g11945 [Hortaea werneckii]KAI6940976.1 hypothetical protein KC348_g4835 [Hortaea werneckii]